MNKLITASILAIGLFAAPAFAGDFSGAFGRSHLPACNAVNGNWTGAFDSCPPLGNGFGAPEAASAPAPVVTEPECPPKEETKA